MDVVYAEYIQSRQWRAFKARYFAQHRKICSGCQANTDIHLHHHTYARLGAEQFDDVVPLCQTCHALVHEYHRQVPGVDLSAATEKITSQIRCASQSAVLRVLDVGRRAEPGEVFVPRHLRGARTDEQGRLVSNSDWRVEVRPWWTQAPHPMERVDGR